MSFWFHLNPSRKVIFVGQISRSHLQKDKAARKDSQAANGGAGFQQPATGQGTFASCVRFHDRRTNPPCAARVPPNYIHNQSRSRISILDPRVLMLDSATRPS